MAAVPIYVWNGTAWQETGPTIPANPIKYQASAPSSPSTGDIWVDSDGDVTTGSQQFQRFRFVASGGETTISGADANGAVLAYTAGLEQVVLNGAVLVRGHDYTATTGTTITGLSPALVASDVLEVFSFIAFTVANTYTQSQVDGLVNAAPGMRLIVPSSATNGTVGATGAVTFSGVSSVRINDCFNSTYQNYKIVYSATQSASTPLKLRLASGASVISTSTYRRGGWFIASGATTASFFGSNSETSVIVQQNSGAFTIDMFSPFEAAVTHMKYDTSVIDGAGYARISGMGYNTNTTSYDGIEFSPDSGTITGTVRIYGYKN
jgi:hypothetical protein